MKTKKQIICTRAKTWQIGFFAFNNTATNMIMFLMGYISYYAAGVVGLSVVLVSSLLTAMRIFDAVTDPIIGFIIDKTNSKFGKFRPMILIGYIIMAISILTMYNGLHLLPDNMKVIGFIVLYGLYIIGYTFQTACTKAGQTCLTNDPSQRPLFTRFDSSYSLLLFALSAQYVSSYIEPKYGGFTLEAMQEFSLTYVIIAGIFTAFAIIGIWSKDRMEFFRIDSNNVKIKFKDYISVLRGNRALQMLMISAASDKLSMQIFSNSTTMIMLYGIVMGNYALYGKMALISIIPSLLIILVGTKYASKFSSKKALVSFKRLLIIMYIVLFLVLFLGNPRNISLDNFNTITVLWIAIFCLVDGFSKLSNGIVIPMIADCADYETYLSGKFIPGMIGTLFSFVDKTISSFGTTIVGFAVAYLGYTSSLPQEGDTCTSALFWVTIVLYIGVPLLSSIISLIAMKFYPLNESKMIEIQDRISKIKLESQVE